MVYDLTSIASKPSTSSLTSGTGVPSSGAHTRHGNAELSITGLKDGAAALGGSAGVGAPDRAAESSPFLGGGWAAIEPS